MQDLMQSVLLEPPCSRSFRLYGSGIHMYPRNGRCQHEVSSVIIELCIMRAIRVKVKYNIDHKLYQ